MAEHIKVGKKGEKEAVKYLNKKGYKILHRNFRSKFGEIDIIADHHNTLVFIEVKTRKNNLFGTPGQAVNIYKQRKIIKTALYYLQGRSNFSQNIRFDIVEVWIQEGIMKDINIITNAFQLT